MRTLWLFLTFLAILLLLSIADFVVTWSPASPDEAFVFISRACETNSFQCLGKFGLLPSVSLLTLASGILWLRNGNNLARRIASISSGAGLVFSAHSLAYLLVPSSSSSLHIALSGASCAVFLGIVILIVRHG